MKKTQISFGGVQQSLLGLGLLIAICFLYLYFLNHSVVQVVIRQEKLQEINQLKTEIALLESKYIEAQHNIAGRIASIEGYEFETDKVFLTRGESSLVLVQD